LRLVVVGGPGIGAQLRLSSHPDVQIGRSPAADLTLDDPHVAEIHLKLYREGNGLVCLDLTGRGFAHNGAAVRKAMLKIGDVISLGQHAVRLIADRPELMPRVDPSQPPAQPPPSEAGRAVLRALRGNDAGKTFPLAGRPITILGRGKTTDVTLWDIRASRAHARIDCTANVYRISDLNSSNGTLVNGNKITTHVLQAGDVIQIGSSVLQFSPTG
jgi:pSer/pThr/pTyr-binding forkhead associated (FHA) protein